MLVFCDVVMRVINIFTIVVIGLVIFGPGKLPGVGKALGQSIKEFKAANKEEEIVEQKQLAANATEKK